MQFLHTELCEYNRVEKERKRVGTPSRGIRANGNWNGILGRKG